MSAIDSIPSEDFEFRALQEAKCYRNALLRAFTDHLHGRVLEVGAGIGQLTESLLQLPSVSELVSIEPDPKFCQRLRLVFPSHSIIEGTIADASTSAKWNAILSVNVLEHIREDERELASYHRLLAPQKGVICLFVPARPEIYSPLDRDFGHFRRYTRPGLQRKLQDSGFRSLALYYFNFVGYFAWWLNFCVLKRRRFDKTSVRLFDRLIFPPTHAIESNLIRPPWGQSLLTIARAE